MRHCVRVGHHLVAGPGNPPVVVDESANLDKAARDVIEGAVFDNNLLCISEKEVFVIESVADAFIAALKGHGAVQLTTNQMDRLSKEVFSYERKEAGGPPEPMLNKAFVGKDATDIARLAGANVPPKTELLFAAALLIQL